MSPAPVSCIIPTYNSGRTLANCLASCLEEGVSAQEIIVVDDERTSDGTREIARGFGVQLVVSNAGIAESRNVGAAYAQQPYLFHLDSDMRLHSGLVAAALDYLVRTAADALVIREEPVGEGPWVAARALDKAALEECEVGQAARFVSRQAFDLIGGYDPALTAGEDADFHLRLKAAGCCIATLPSPSVDHDEGRVRLGPALAKKFRYGTTMPAYVQKHTRLMTQSEGLARLRAGLRSRSALPAGTKMRFLLLKSTEWLGFSVGQVVGRASTPLRRRARASRPRAQVEGGQVLVLCCSTLPRSPSGGEVLTIRLAETLAVEGQSVILMTTPEARDVYSIQTETVNVYTLRARHPAGTLALYGRRAVEVLGMVWHLERETGPPDWVVATSFYPPDIAGALLARALGSRLIFSWQLAIPNPFKSTFDGRRVVARDVVRSSAARRAWLRQAASFVAQAFALTVVRCLHGVILAPTGTEVGFRFWPVAVPRVVFHEYVADRPPNEIAGRQRDARPIDCIFLGRLHAQKGIKDLAEVWRLLRDDRPGLGLVVIGEGAETEAKVLRELEKASQGKVQLLGTVTGARKLELLAQSRVLIFPSHYESFGLAVDEALACGTPAVSFALPCLERRLSSVVAFASVGDIAAMKELVGHYIDDADYWAAAHRRALRYSSQRSWRVAFRDLLDLISEAKAI